MFRLVLLSQQKRQDIALAMSAVELAPLAAQNEIALQTYTKVPLSRVTALGAGQEPLVAAVQQVTNEGQAVSGYYKVTIPPGTHLAAFNDGTGLLGTAMNETGIAAQARLNPLMACFHYWLFGHYHNNKIIDDRFVLLWEQMVRVV